MLQSMSTFRTRENLNDLSREFLTKHDLTWFDISHYSPHQQHELQLKFMWWLLRQLKKHEHELVG
jgi:hypothetical protein